MRYPGNKPDFEYKNVASTLLKKFSDFAQSRDADDENEPYIVFGDFAIYMRDGIERGWLSKEFIDDAFSFLNEMGSIRDMRLQNLLVVGVFEILTDTEKSVSIAKRKLTGQALNLFERTLAGWTSP